MSRPRRRFGQHFLADRAVVLRMLDAFAPRPGQRIVEIGPGRGALTGALTAAAPGCVTAVEIDRDLARALQNRYPPHHLTVINADILDFDLRALDDGDGDDGDTRARSTERGRCGDGEPKLRLIGNLPYNISTPLLFRLLAQLDCIADMHFMFQREVALRLCAGPGSKNYGRLTVFAALKLDCAALFDVPPGAFMPRPQVESTVLRLTPKSRPHQASPRLDAVVAAAFNQRRKTVRNSLAGLADSAHFARAGVDPGRRAADLAVEDFIALADAIDAAG